MEAETHQSLTTWRWREESEHRFKTQNTCLSEMQSQEWSKKTSESNRKDEPKGENQTARKVEVENVIIKR